MTIQFALKSQGIMAEAGVSGLIREYALGFIQPFGTLWFIYLLAIFFVVCKALRRVPPVMVFIDQGQRLLAGLACLIAPSYGVRYAPNTRETIRDDAVKFFVGEGLVIRNPDDANRPTHSGKTPATKIHHGP